MGTFDTNKFDIRKRAYDGKYVIWAKNVTFTMMADYLILSMAYRLSLLIHIMKPLTS